MPHGQLDHSPADIFHGGLVERVRHVGEPAGERAFREEEQLGGIAGLGERVVRVIAVTEIPMRAREERNDVSTSRDRRHDRNVRRSQHGSQEGGRAPTPGGPMFRGGVRRRVLGIQEQGAIDHAPDGHRAAILPVIVRVLRREGAEVMRKVPPAPVQHAPDGRESGRPDEAVRLQEAERERGMGRCRVLLDHVAAGMVGVEVAAVIRVVREHLAT